MRWRCNRILWVFSQKFYDSKRFQPLFMESDYSFFLCNRWEWIIRPHCGPCWGRNYWNSRKRTCKKCPLSLPGLRNRRKSVCYSLFKILKRVLLDGSSWTCPQVTNWADSPPGRESLLLACSGRSIAISRLYYGEKRQGYLLCILFASPFVIFVSSLRARWHAEEDDDTP